MAERLEQHRSATRDEECQPGCPLSGWTFRALWPVQDLDLGSRAAIEQATADLPEVVERTGARLLADPYWSVEEVADATEWPYTECAVVACAPAVPARPTREQWPAIFAHLVAHHWSDRRISALLELSTASVTSLRRQHAVSVPTRAAA